MKERIIEALKKVHRALNYEEIDSLLNNKTIEETKEMSEALDELEKDGEIYHSNKNKYMLFSDSNLRKGTLRVNKKGFGFVEVQDEEDIFIPIDNINDAINNDIVAVEITETKDDGKREWRIVRIIKRNLSTVVGEIYFKKGIGHIIPDDKNTNDTENNVINNEETTLLEPANELVPTTEAVATDDTTSNETNALFNEETLRVSALEISGGPLDDLIDGRWYATAYHVQPMDGVGHVTVPAIREEVNWRWAKCFCSGWQVIWWAWSISGCAVIFAGRKCGSTQKGWFGKNRKG